MFMSPCCINKVYLFHQQQLQCILGIIIVLCPKKYKFCENAPEFHVVAAGSLLGVAINRQNYSFPVGKVETIPLYPFDFEEFLLAMGEERLSAEIQHCYDLMEAMPEGLHLKAIELYRMYLFIGGMPACINAFKK